MKITLVLLLAASAIAQTPAPVITQTAAGITVYPSYMVSFGGGYTRYNGAPNIAEGDISAAYGLGAGNYLVTTIDFFAAQTSIREGYEKILKCAGHLCLSARVDAGISAVAPIIGSFAGGAVIRWDLGGISPHLAGTFVSGELRVTGATAVASSTAVSTNAAGQTVTTTTSSVVGAGGLVVPGFFFSIGKSW